MAIAISVISSRVINPSPFISYSWNVQRSFSSIVPRNNVERFWTNSYIMRVRDKKSYTASGSKMSISENIQKKNGLDHKSESLISAEFFFCTRNGKNYMYTFTRSNWHITHTHKETSKKTFSTYVTDNPNRKHPTMVALSLVFALCGEHSIQIKNTCTMHFCTKWLCDNLSRHQF